MLCIKATGLGQSTLTTFFGSIADVFELRAKTLPAVDEAMLRMTLIHLDIRSHTPSKEYLARIYYALEPLLEYANDDVKLGEWLFVDYIAFGNQVIVGH